MAHVLKLGFVQNPSSGDYIDLGGSTNVSGKGYHLLSYKEGPVYLDVFGHSVRDLTIVLDVDGSSVVNALANYRAINHYIQQTRMFLAPFQGNYAAATDGTWFSGFAATLTFQPQNATGPIFWDVLDGNVEMTEAFLGPDILGSRLSNVVVTLTVSYTARGALVTMNNLVAMGSFEPPFNPADSYFCAGWGFDTVANWSLDTTTSVYGSNSLKWVPTASGSNEIGHTNESDDLTNATTVSASVWLRYSGMSALFSIVLQGFFTASSTWGSLSTVFSQSGGTNTTWTKYTVSAVSTSGVTKVRLAFITNGTGTLWIDGAAIYKGSILPPNGEYFTHGRTVGFPSAYLYGAAGDVEAPCIIHAGRPSSSTASTDKYQTLIVGAREYNPTTAGRAGMASMAFMTADGAADTTQFWGKAGHSITTSSSVFRFPIVSATNMNPTTLRIPRKYRVFLVYTTITFPIISAVSIYVNSASRPMSLGYFVVDLPITGGIHNIYELGDTVFPPPDFAAANQTLDLTSAVIDLASNGTSATMEVGGVLLIPVEGYATSDDLNTANSNTRGFSSMGSPDGSAGKAIYVTTKDYSPANFYDATSRDIASYTVDNIKVIPGSMQFEILTLGSRGGTNSMTNPLYYYDASRAVSVTLAYQPRYLSGGI